MSNEDPNNPGKQCKDTLNVGSSDRIPYDKDEVDNICLQTGEEFSAEFLRDRVALRRFPIINDVEQHLPNNLNFHMNINNNNNNYQMVYEDLKRVPGQERMGSDSNMDLPDNALATSYVTEIDNRAYPNNLSRYHYEHGIIRQASGTFSRQLSSKFSGGCDQATSGPNTPSIFGVESPLSCHPYGPIFSESSFYKKIKFLCSFGGRILPRPNDGKLRYVGGETRIISIRKNITHEELTRKTSAICNQTHIIKYQLPGEDLDALISVCSDEDLHHMIEEYEELERAGGSQRLRIFLIPLHESESPRSNESRVNQPNDTDYHYVVAVNGMLDPSPRKRPSGLSLVSHTSQFGNTSDYNSPQRDSSTYAFSSDIKDCSPTSTNLAGTLSKPDPFLTALKVAGKSFNQTPPASPICVQPKDPKISNVQLFTDQPYNVVIERITPFFMEKVPRDNSLYVDSNNYVDPTAYYNNCAQGTPCVNYHPSNQYISESGQVQRPSNDFHFHRRNNSKEFVSSAICSQTDMIFERPVVINEGSYHLNKIVSRSHESSNVFPMSDDKEGSQYRLLHALSDSTLQENDENYKCLLQFPPSVEKESSLEISRSLEECSIQPGEISDMSESRGNYPNSPTFGITDSCKRLSKFSKENLHCADKSTDWFEEKVGAMSQDRHLQYIYFQHGASSSSPDLQSTECNAHAAPFVSSQSTRNMTEQPHGIPLDTVASEYSMRSQNSSMHRQYAPSETSGSQPSPLGSFELQPMESQTNTESVPPISVSKYPIIKQINSKLALNNHSICIL